jgi:hypothetical protein
VRRECVHPGNLRRQRPRNDPPVPRNSPKNRKSPPRPRSRHGTQTQNS